MVPQEGLAPRLIGSWIGGLFAWTELFGATGVEPTVEALDQFKTKVAKP
jgi:acetyl-CoA acetyltransferase